MSAHYGLSMGSSSFAGIMGTCLRTQKGTGNSLQQIGVWSRLHLYLFAYIVTVLYLSTRWGFLFVGVRASDQACEGDHR